MGGLIMNRLAVIKDSVVENVVAVEVDTLQPTIEFWEAQGYVCVLSDVAGTGDTYENGEFLSPSTPPAPVPVWEWFIDIGPFMDRFGTQKLPILASTDVTVQAVVKDMQARKWIDLERADVGQALDLLLSKGFAIDKAAILTTPVTDPENLALRKLYFS